jgi:hypothetical protein
MNRRKFLNGLGTMSALPFLSNHALTKTNPDDLVISDIQVIRVSGKTESFDFHYQNQVTPLTVYPEHKLPPYPTDEKAKKEIREHSNLYLKIATNGGPEGFYGLIDPEAALVVMHQLRSFLIGQNPMATETLWDKMYRLNRHARTGHFMMAISAVDNALWDLRGKYFNVPVYQLLGGPTRESIEFYASCLDIRYFRKMSMNDASLSKMKVIDTRSGSLPTDWPMVQPVCTKMWNW